MIYDLESILVSVFTFFCWHLKDFSNCRSKPRCIPWVDDHRWRQGLRSTSILWKNKNPFFLRLTRNILIADHVQSIPYWWYHTSIWNSIQGAQFFGRYRSVQILYGGVSECSYTLSAAVLYIGMQSNEYHVSHWYVQPTLPLVVLVAYILQYQILWGWRVESRPPCQSNRDCLTKIGRKPAVFGVFLLCNQPVYSYQYLHAFELVAQCWYSLLNRFRFDFSKEFLRVYADWKLVNHQLSSLIM